MIDLRNKSLPNAITVDGKDFLVKTDYREWIKFWDLFSSQEERPLSDYLYLFVDDVPQCNFFPYLLLFFYNPNITPRRTGNGDNTKIIDYVQDGEYIIASFWKDYGINLLEVDMHWHLFQALLIGLSDESKMKQIMGMRSWRNEKKSYEERARLNKEAWSFPKRTETEQTEIMDEINKEFYNS